MKLFFITYDLVSPGKDYQGLFNKLTLIGAKRVLLSVWAVKGNLTAAQLRDALKDYIDANDRLLAIESADWASWRAMIDINQVWQRSNREVSAGKERSSLRLLH